MNGLAKIPLVLGLTLMILGIISATNLSQSNQNPQRKAAEEVTPPIASASATPNPSVQPLR